MALIQHWPLNDNAASTTVVASTGTNGTLVGGDNTSDKHLADGPGGSITSCFDLNGTDDAIDVSGSSVSFSSGSPFTISAWVKWDTTTNGQGYVTGQSAAAPGRWGRFNSNLIIDTSFSTVSFTGFSPTTTNWHHIVVTRNASNGTRMWMDGVESSTGTVTVTGTFAFDHIGLRSGAYFNGRIAWVKVFDSDESANVATLYAEGSGSPPSSIVPILYMNALNQGML